MIKGLQPRLAEAGKIKIGGKGETRQGRSGPYRLPVKHDYFTITTTQREGGDPQGDLIPDDRLMGALADASYADRDGKIRRLPIMLHSDVIDEVFPTAYVAYHGKRMFCRGDGEKATRREIKGGEWTGVERQVECPCPYLEENERGERRCKPNGTLHCSIALPGHSVAGAVHRWRTTSIISIQQMIASLHQVRDQVVGTLQGIPLTLTVRPLQVTPKGKSVTVFVCHVELRASDLSAVQRDAIGAAQARKELAAAMGRNPTEAQYRAMLIAPGEDDDEDPDIAPEYYPDEVIGTTPAGAGVAMTTAEAERLRRAAAPAAEVVEPEPNTPKTGAMCARCIKPKHDTDLIDGVCSACRSQEPEQKACPGDDPIKGKRRANKCSVGGGLYYAESIVDGVCYHCRGEAPPAPEPDPLQPVKCSGCGNDFYPEQLTGGKCAECASKAPAPPARPGSPDAPKTPQTPPHERFTNVLQDGIRAGRFDHSQALTAFADAYPEVAQAAMSGDNSRWTDEIADGAIELLNNLAKE